MRQRIAVLGGGVAGLSTALALTATPELRDQYEVTLYQLGWRCGGKCTTGRSLANSGRVEEHGLHLWFGGYDNAFALLATCYDELNRPPDHPIPTMDRAWSPLSGVVLYDWYQGRWSSEFRGFAVEPGRPWDPVEEPRFWDLLAEILESHRRRWPPSGLSPERISPLGRLARRIGDRFERSIVRAAEAVVARHRRRDTTSRAAANSAAWLLSLVRGHAWRRARAHIDDDEVRHHLSRTDFGLTTMIGLIRDQVLWNGFGAINHLDLRAWLSRHGAQPTTLHGPDVRVLYDESFADSIGPATTATGEDRFRRLGGGFAAGAALYGAIRTALPYRGSVMWQATGGMGDTAIVPMYQTLVQRGVAVKFFQQITRIGVDPPGARVDRVEIREQARPRLTYQPLVDIKGLPCWPNEPLWDQLEDGEKLEAAGVAFELGEAEPDAAITTLHFGEDFDDVVLAISAAALPAVCGEAMAASSAFRSMLDHTHTTMTQAFQLWLTTPPDELGFPYGHAATSSFVEPVDTAADNSQLLWSEDWPPGQAPRSVWYFCGIMHDVEGEESAEQTDERARRAAYGYLDAIGQQWPQAVGSDGFRWELLATMKDVMGPSRLDTQYWRANATPSERYVQTLPDTVQFRLRADESGLAHLYLAGDWTRNGMDIGAVEATVMSGLLAARAISGSPAKIAWEREAWMVNG